MSSGVLDASALLALLKAETGSDHVRAVLAGGAVMSSVNLSETVAKLSEAGLSEAEIRDAIEPLALGIVDFTADQAYAAGLLRQPTRSAGLSLGDRACLGLARSLGLAVVTADRHWRDLTLGITIQLIR